MTIDRVVIQEKKYPEFMTWNKINDLLGKIPYYGKDDPRHPEWPPTDVFPLDLTKDGYGLVWVKDESTNPTGTIKDRPGWEFVSSFRDYFNSLLLKKKKGLLNGNLETIHFPRLSLITAGNEGRALTEAFKKYGLPPIKIIVDKYIPKERLELLKTLYIDIYQVNLSEKALSPKEIKQISNNPDGIDITSTRMLEPQVVFYD